MTPSITAESWKQKLWAEVDDRRGALIELLAEVIRRPSDNPPGDTTELAAFVKETLEQSGVTVDIHEPKANNPNVVASLVGRTAGRHLLLNGHLDQFPVERPEAWTSDPYSGEVRDGHIYGRGAADMKGGTTALLAAMVLLAELEVPLAGRLTLTLVSDEETGGRWGAEWLLENHPELLGDAVLNAEPSSPDAIYVAEKGICWLKVTTHAAGGHSGLSPADNAVFKMNAAIQAGLKLRGQKGDVPASLRNALATSQALLEELPHGKGNSWVLDSVTLNVGTIRGGVKANVVPAHCEAEFDFRIPVGITPDDLIDKFKDLLREQGLADDDFVIEPILVGPPSHTEPEEEILQTLAQNVEAVTGQYPHFHFMYGGTDCRFWRFKGVPAGIFGPRPSNIGAPDEYIEIEDYLTTLKVHLGAIVDYLGTADDSQ